MGKIMAESRVRITLLLMATLAITVPCLVDANIGEFDEYLIGKAKEARRAALEAYEPNPLSVASELNMHVHLAMNEASKENNTRGRNLKGKKGAACVATNPIDRCWRCDKNWEQNRFKLAKCAMGFGRKTTGGLGGKIYVVNDSSDGNLTDPEPGTLRYGVIQKEPLWIIFKHSMVIKFKQELMVNSHKTIDGRGANIHIKNGAGITVQMAQNVIIHNLRFRNIRARKGGMIRDSPDHVGLRTRSDGDGISIYGATNVWIDHVSMSNADDGLIDAIMGSTAITISNCHMTKHNDVMLFGARDKDKIDKVSQITVAFNHFGKGLVQRMPRTRYGWYHMVNNQYSYWFMYAMGGTENPTMLSQGNRFSAPYNMAAKEVTSRVGEPPHVWKDWQWQSDLDVFVNGAYFTPSGKPIIVRDPAMKEALISPRHGSEAPELAMFSGQLECKVGRPC